MAIPATNGPRRLLAPRILAALLSIFGLLLAAGGGQLIALGGSAYYLVTGLACLASAWCLWTGRMLGVWIYLAILAGTAVWSVVEVGLDPWALMPRMAALLAAGLYMALPFNWRPLVAAPAPSPIPTQPAQVHP